MLGRAAATYQPPPQPRKDAVQNPTPLASQGIDTMLKNTRSGAQKSIGGYTSYRNTTIEAGASTKLAYKAPAVAVTKPTVNGVAGRKRSSAEMNGLVAALHKADSFKETYYSDEITPVSARTIDLTQENPERAKASLPAIHAPIDFDPDDFDNDSDLDLDYEFPAAMPISSAPREPLHMLSPNQTIRKQVGFSPKTALRKRLELPVKASTPQKQKSIPSSAMTWSSSPLSHMGPPMALQEQAKPESPPRLISSEPSVDANPRPAKRRTTPWMQKEEDQRIKEEEEAEALERKREIEPPSRSFVGMDFMAKRKNESTPQRKDAMPWNKTASALKNEQKLHKAKLVRIKGKPATTEDMAAAARQASKEVMSPIFLSEEQRNVQNLVVDRNQSAFFTGSAGTGKSVLMRSIISELRKKYAKEADRVAVTASTGLAACNIGGVTLHSFGGIGLGKEEVPELVKKIKRNQKARHRWLRTKVLIIDEISMVDGDLFDKLEAIARLIRNNGRPFGGIQLVITGDFFQLPPVPDYGSKREIKFAFEAGTWQTSINHTIGLTEVFRQRDPVFANMLNEMRLGKISDSTIKTFRRLERDLDDHHALKATELFPTRQEVDSANANKMRTLKGKSFFYKAKDSGAIRDEAQRDRLLANCMAPLTLELKKGAQVMLIKNMDEGLVNGSVGQVIAFMDEDKYEYYIEHEDEFNDLEAQSTDEIERRYPANPKLQALRNKELTASTSELYPLVRFAMADGTTRDYRLKPEDWKIELPNGEVQAQRQQLPLILAYALSIHKAQGQTLERVKVDLKRVFENGQAYVALSRAVSQEGLCVKNFNQKAVMAHPRVAAFYNSLYSVNKALMNPKVAPARPKSKSKSRSSTPPPGVTAREYQSDWKQGNIDEIGAYGSYDFDDEEEAMTSYG